MQLTSKSDACVQESQMTRQCPKKTVSKLLQRDPTEHKVGKHNASPQSNLRWTPTKISSLSLVSYPHSVATIQMTCWLRWCVDHKLLTGRQEWNQIRLCPTHGDNNAGVKTSIWIQQIISHQSDPSTSTVASIQSVRIIVGWIKELYVPDGCRRS